MHTQNIGLKKSGKFKKIYSQFKRSIPKFEEGLKTKLDGTNIIRLHHLKKIIESIIAFTKKGKKLI